MSRHRAKGRRTALLRPSHAKQSQPAHCGLWQASEISRCSIRFADIQRPERRIVVPCWLRQQSAQLTSKGSSSRLPDANGTARNPMYGLTGISTARTPPTIAANIAQFSQTNCMRSAPAYTEAGRCHVRIASTDPRGLPAYPAHRLASPAENV